MERDGVGIILRPNVQRFENRARVLPGSPVARARGKLRPYQRAHFSSVFAPNGWRSSAAKIPTPDRIKTGKATQPCGQLRGTRIFCGVGKEDRAVNRDQRRERELGEGFETARIIGRGLEGGEISRHAGKKKGGMKTTRHEEEEIAVGFVEVELEEFVGAEERELKADREHGGIKRRKAKTEEEMAIELPEA